MGKWGSPMVNNTVNGNGHNYRVKNTDISDYDLIIIEGCGTDFKLNVPLGKVGTIGNTNFNIETFCGALRDIIEYILINYPEKRIVMIAEHQHDNSGYNVNRINDVGCRLIDYVDCMIAIGNLYGIPVCDWYRNCGINEFNLNTYTVDGVHLNAEGYKLVGDCAASVIGSMHGCTYDSRKTDYVVNAKHYGIDPFNDGVSNSVNLQGLINRINLLGGGTIYIPSGTYEFASNGEYYLENTFRCNYCVTMKSNVHIVGDGDSTILTLVGETTKGLRMFHYDSKTSTDSYTNYLNNCSFKNLIIDGSNVAITEYDSSAKGFSLSPVNKCHWDNVIVRNMASSGFGIDCPIDCTINNCIAQNCGTGTTVDGSGACGFEITYGLSNDECMNLSNCRAYGNKRYGFYFEHKKRYFGTDESNPYTATINNDFVVNNCYSANNNWNFGANIGVRIVLSNCHSRNATKFGYHLLNSQHCIISKCTSLFEQDSSYVIQSVLDSIHNMDYPTKCNSLIGCISATSFYGVKIVQINTEGTQMFGNIIKDCFINRATSSSIMTMGAMEELIMNGNIITNENNSFDATVTTLIDFGNSWNQ